MRRLLPALLFIALLGALDAAAETDIYRLQIGDPSRTGREIPLALDALTDSRTGELFTPDELAARLEDVRILFVGESHTSIDFHRAQLRVIEELREAGRPVLVGLEMYPYTEQDYLDQWSTGLLTEEGFLELSNWYKNWGYHWDYYRDIFLFARENGVRMFAINTPPDVVKAVREKGFKDLTEEEAAHIPAEVDTDSDEHLQLFKAFFDDADSFHMSMTDEQWRGMFNAQCTWDATMGFNAVHALKEHGGEDAIMVVLIGSGHVAYGLGIQRQAAHWFDGKMATLVPIPVRDADDETVESVIASYSDFLWGLPQETDPIYPGLGLATTEVEETGRRRVVHVAEDSVGEKAGVRLGDVLTSFDGHDLPNRETMNRLLSKKRWGDGAELTVQRGEESLKLEVYFRRDDSEDDEDAEDEEPEETMPGHTMPGHAMPGHAKPDEAEPEHAEPGHHGAAHQAREKDEAKKDRSE